MAKLKKASTDTSTAFHALSTQARSLQLTLSYGLRVGLALGIVFLMTVKPDLWPSIFAVVVGSIAGLLVAYAMRKIGNRTGVACPPWRCSIQPAPDSSAH